MNAEDNEYVELADIRGAVAEDLSGAFAEWEVHAHSMTKCEKYLYSLSVNPDLRQGGLTRTQYTDYIDRAEQGLGLGGQPRAIVYHIKDGREHCHVVWSRIDIQEMKAIHIPFDKQKLMMVTREFARDHDLKLPDGYFRNKNQDRDKRSQLSLYEKSQQDATGISREDRVELVTEIWRRSDSAKAFVAGLDANGYMLATGDRPYLLVDVHGHVNALPKLIADKRVRTKDLKAFLEKDYPLEDLPDVEEARALAAEYRKAKRSHQKQTNLQDRREELRLSQERRRTRLLREINAGKENQKAAHAKLLEKQKTERKAKRAAFLMESRRLRQERRDREPTGLAGFLSDVSGISLVRKKWNKRQDRLRHDVYHHERREIQQRHHTEREALRLAHQTQTLEWNRRTNALSRLDVRERQSLERQFKLEASRRLHRGPEHMPSLQLALSPPGRRAVPYKAKHRYAKPGTAKSPALENLSTGNRSSDHWQGGQAIQSNKDAKSEFEKAAAVPPEERNGEERRDGTEGRFPIKGRNGPNNERDR